MHKVCPKQSESCGAQQSAQHCYSPPRLPTFPVTPAAAHNPRRIDPDIDQRLLVEPNRIDRDLQVDQEPAAGDLELAQRFGERLRTLVGWEPVPVPGRPDLAITVSVGLAAGEATDKQALVGLADASLYAAKTGGRDQVVLAPTG